MRVFADVDQIAEALSLGEISLDTPVLVGKGFHNLESKSGRQAAGSARGLSYLDRTNTPYKCAMRSLLVHELAALPGSLKVLTMPSLTWDFEYSLLRARESEIMVSGLVDPVTGKLRTVYRTMIYAIEWSNVVFKAALRWMPGASDGLRCKVKPAQTWKVRSRLVQEYERVSFEEWEPPKDGRLRAAWIDLCGPLTEKRIDKIAELWRAERFEFLTVTWLRARQKDLDYLKSRLLELVAGAERVEVYNYSDTSPMSQLMVWKYLWTKRDDGLWQRCKHHSERFEAVT